jgi:hypothetical protein
MNFRTQTSDTDRSREPQLSATTELKYKQKKQIQHLKEEFLKLRETYHQEKKANSFEQLQYEKRIASVRRQADHLQAQLDELRRANENEEHEELAAAVIEEIWTILSDYRREVFTNAEFCDDRFQTQSLLGRETETRLPNDAVIDVEPMPMPPPTPDLPPSLKTPSLSQADAQSSIASRRTRRTPGGTVFYGEPSMKQFIAPNSPYVFTLTKPPTPRVYH